MTVYTPNINLALPDFNVAPWHDDVNDNFSAIDAVIKSLFGIDNLKGEYVNSTAVLAGERYYDAVSGFYYEAVSAFTTEAAPTTFASERTTYPARWTLLDASAAIASASAAAASATAAAADVVLTNADVVTTNADVVLTNADAAQTALDVAQTILDRAQTALDVIATNADAVTCAALVASLGAVVTLEGSWDASAGAFPGSGAATKGNSWLVSVAGTVDGIVFSINDRVIAIVDNASSTTYTANWIIADYSDQVSSFIGRTGAVVAAASDYNASQIDNDSGVAGAFVDDALDALDTAKAAAVHTHAISDITNLQTMLDGGTSAGDLVKLDGSAKLPAVDGSQLTKLPSSGETLAIFNALKIATLEGGTTSLVGGIADPFYDETDVDAGSSANQTYDAAGDYYHNPGTSEEGTVSDAKIDTNVSNQANQAVRFDAPRSANVVSAKINFDSASGTGHFELWGSTAGADTSQIGSDSETITLAAGENIATFPTPPAVTSGAEYWMVFQRDTGSSVASTCTRVTGVFTEDRSSLGAFNSSYANVDAGENLMISAVIDGATPANMTLQSNSFTAGAAPDTARVLWQIDPIDAITLNTDVIASVSRDGGTTWTTATLVEVETVNSSILLYEDASMDISGQPSGTSMLWKLTTANNKEIRVHGVALQWS